ncbi:MAG: diaminopimelate epimerase [Pseudonocardiaceae bacterium]
MMKFNRRDFAAEYDAFHNNTANGVPFSTLKFSIMHGNGNIIMVVDEALSDISAQHVDSALAREICQSYRAIRVDGIAFVRTTRNRVRARVRMTYFEWDGTHSQMCGNALRCVTRYCAEQGYIATDEDFIGTDDGEKWVSTAGGRIRVGLGAGREFQKVAQDRYFVFSGLPHLVLLVEDLPSVDVRSAGRPLRYHDELCRRLNHPEGLHVDFIQRNRNGISVRTYEVGVEDETLACGTGVAGSAFVAHQVWGLPFPIRVQVRGGEMTVEHNEHGLLISGVTGYLFSNIETASAATYAA